MNKTDKRSRKTIGAIQNTVLKLMCTRKMNEIKIVDLCTEADINRTTFYLHFAGVADVLQSLRTEIVEKVFADGELLVFLNTSGDPLPFLTKVTDVIDGYENFEAFVRSSPDADVFLTTLKNAFSAEIFRRYEAKYERAGKDAIYIIHFLTSGVLDTFTEWLKTEKTVPLSEILDKCAPMVSAGYRTLTQLSEA